MKVKRLTRENRNGVISLVKKDIDFDMFSPVISKVMTEALEQLAEFERKSERDELFEIPFSIGGKVELNVDNKIIIAEVSGYEILKKEIVIIFEAKDTFIHMNIRDALKKVKVSKTIGSVIGT